MLRIRALETGRRRGRARRLLVTSITAVLTWAAAGNGRAEAQSRLGAPHQLVITAEDLTGYFAEQRKFEDVDHNKYTENAGRLSLIFRSGGVRLGVHYFVIPALSLGATLGYESRTGSVTVPDGGGTYTQARGSEWTLVFQPKLGYALMVSEVVGFWFRGGPGYLHTSNYPNGWDPEHEVRETLWTFGLDAWVAIMPVPNFGLLLGPSGDLSFAGSRGETYTDNGVRIDYDHKASYRRLGATLGLVGAF